MNTDSFLHDILLLFLSLAQQNNSDTITRLFIEALNALIPGMNFKFEPQKPIQPEYQERVFTKDYQFGWITAGKKCNHLPEEQKALVRNSIRMLAIILENANQRLELNNANLLLENQVAKRTQQLEETVSALKISQEQLEKERAHLTERVEERTAELQEAYEKLEEAMKHRETFLSNMSHELRTPLTAILGNAELMKMQRESELNPKQLHFIDNIMESGSHLLALINDILNYSKIDANQFSLHPEKVQLETLCHQSIQYITVVTDQKNITFDYQYELDQPFITADPVRLKQVLLNLLNNAVKFTPQGGTIGLKVSKHATLNSVMIEVWDTGIGISSEDQRKIFEPFVQIDHRLERTFEGTGLGLAISKSLIEMHGGTISLESSANQGSRFTILLPL